MSGTWTTVPSVRASVPQCTGGPSQLQNTRKKNEKEIKCYFQVIKLSNEKILKESHKYKMNVLNATELCTLFKKLHALWNPVPLYVIFILPFCLSVRFLVDFFFFEEIDKLFLNFIT